MPPPTDPPPVSTETNPVPQDSFTTPMGTSTVSNNTSTVSSHALPTTSQDDSREIHDHSQASQNALGVILCIVVLSVAIMARFLLIWQYHQCRVMLRKKLGRLDSKEKRYSATVLHCDHISDTDDWVLNNFPKQLEKNVRFTKELEKKTTGLPLFLRGRDDVSLAGHCEVEILTEAMERSQKVVFVIDEAFCQDKLLKFLWRISLIMCDLTDLVLILYKPLQHPHILKLPYSLQQLLSDRTVFFGENPVVHGHFACVSNSSEVHILQWKQDDDIAMSKFWRDLRYILHGRHQVLTRQRTISLPALGSSMDRSGEVPLSVTDQHGSVPGQFRRSISSP